MLVKTRALVFRTMKYRETSLIVDLYTERLGLQKVVVNGVRSRSAKTKANIYQVLSLLDTVMYYREDREMHRLREVTSEYVYERVPFDVHRGAVGMFIAEVARKTIRNTEKNEELFQYLHGILIYLDRTTQPIANIHLYFLLELSRFFGFYPDVDPQNAHSFFDLQEGWYVKEAPVHGQFLDADLSGQFAELQKLDLETCHTLKLTRQSRHTLLDKLLDYYRLHLENLPAIYAHQILRDVF